MTTGFRKAFMAKHPMAGRLGTVFLVLAALLFSWWAVQQADRQLREDLLKEIAIVSRNIGRIDVHALQGYSIRYRHDSL